MSDLCLFNIQDGYAEALLRGLRKGFLTEMHYGAIKSVNNARDFKTALMDTDYADFVKEWDEQESVTLKLLLKEISLNVALLFMLFYCKYNST